MSEKFESNILKQREIQALIDELSGKDLKLFERYIKLPNKPDIQPEVMGLVLEYGDRFPVVSDQIEVLRQKLGISYDELRDTILDKLESK